ncbi:hypothetical protein GCM10009548_85390 [Streptomyces malaysiensis subsp. malaysiensis]
MDGAAAAGGDCEATTSAPKTPTVPARSTFRLLINVAALTRDAPEARSPPRAKSIDPCSARLRNEFRPRAPQPERMPTYR